MIVIRHISNLAVMCLSILVCQVYGVVALVDDLDVAGLFHLS